METSIGYFFMRVMVTPAVYPRWFELLTTLTFRALGRNHIVSIAFETIAKKRETKKARCPREISNLS